MCRVAWHSKLKKILLVLCRIELDTYDLVNAAHSNNASSKKNPFDGGSSRRCAHRIPYSKFDLVERRETLMNMIFESHRTSWLGSSLACAATAHLL